LISESFIRFYTFIESRPCTVWSIL